MRSSVPSSPHNRPSTPHIILALACAGLVSFAAHGATVALANPARPRPSMEVADKSLPPLYLKNHIVNAEIHGRVARVVTESVYHNDTSQQLEAIYVFPLPQGATVEKFIMWMDGKPVEAQVGEKNAARQTYEEIVRRKKDPGLIEQVADGVFKMRIFPVLPGADQKVRLEYSHVLPLTSNGTVLNFDYPLAANAPSEGGKQELIASNFVVSVSMDMEAPIASIESSSHAISQHIRDGEPNRARASIEQVHTALDRDFTMKIALKTKALPISALTYRPAPADGKVEEGTVMLLITPELIASEEIPGKDVVMVMDVSGSMQGSKIEQARAALRACLKRLRPGDRFAIESFSDDVTVFRNDWSEANSQNIDNALTFVNGLHEGGSTNIEEAIHRALAYKGEPGRLRQILFATDGCPTVGQTDVKELSESAARKGQNDPENVDTRFFTFGIGYDVNTVLLDKMAALTHGDRAYVRPEEDIARKVGDLCDKIAAPVLTNVTVTFSDNLNIQHTYPPQTGDLYMGRQTVLTARYATPGVGQVTIRGKRAGKDVVIQAPLTLPESTPEATSYLAKQWAIRKVGFLLDQIHLNGEQAELRDEVIRLGTKFSIVTPYTSYLALEPEHKTAQVRPMGSAVRSPSAAPASGEAHETVIPPDILANAKMGDHFETINPDRADTHSALGNPDAQIFHSVAGSSDGAVGGGGISGGQSIDDFIGMGGTPSTGTGAGWGGGNGTGTGVDAGTGHGSFGNRNGGGRTLMVKRFGGSKATESSVDAALRWLATHQEADGHFDSAKFGAKSNLDAASTGLALLSFLGAGHTEKMGQFKDNVRRAVAWLSARKMEGAALSDEDIIATLALAEAAGMSNIAETRAVAQHALDYITKVDPTLQNARLGNANWTSQKTYSVEWFVLALKSSKVAGLSVPVKAFESALDFINGCEKKTGEVSRFSPTKSTPQTDPSAAAAALVCRQMLGSHADELASSVDALLVDGGVPVWDTLNPSYVYFGTLCAFQQGGDIWKRWNEAEKKALTDNQSKTGEDDGSWTMKSAAAEPLGRVAQTAISSLCLETYYRYKQISPASAMPSPSVPAQTQQPVPLNSKADSGQAGVDYSEYIRQMKEGIEPSGK